MPQQLDSGGNTAVGPPEFLVEPVAVVGGDEVSVGELLHRALANLASWMTTIEEVRDDLTFSLEELNRIDRVMAENLL